MPRTLAAKLRALVRAPNRPLLLLLTSLALVCVALFDAQRAVRSHRAVAEGLLRDYAAFAAWSYGHAVAVALDSLAWSTLGPVMHEFPHQGPVPHATVLVHARRYNPFRGEHVPWRYPPSTFFGYALGSDTLGAVRNALGDPRGGWRVDSLPAITAAERALMRDTVLAHLRTRFRPGWRYAVFAAGMGDERRLVGYTLMPAENGDTIVYGTVTERATYDRLLHDLFARQPLLPAAVTGGLPNDSMLVVRVSDASGTLFVSGSAPKWRFSADEALPPALGGVRVRAAVRPRMASRLAIGGLPRSRLPLLLGVLALVTVLTGVAVGQLRREGELARLRGDFVASVSHELRSPLAQVRLFVETLVHGRATTEAQRRWALENVDRETTRLANLVENVLLFSRPERGDAPLAPAELARETELAVRSFEPLAAVRRVRLETALQPGVVAAVHAESFRQVLVNLLDNAVKYGPPGQTVTVALRAADGGARLEVSDQGPGVPAAEREAVWRPFFRGGAPAVRAAGGSGIGLAIVRDLVARHGGRAWVEDAPGGGACFVVWLPAVERSAIRLETDGAEAVDADVGAEV